MTKKTKQARSVLTEPMQKTLAYLFASGPQKQLDLSASTVLGLKAGVVPSLKALQSRGLVLRRAYDRRSSAVWELTPIAREIMTLGRAVGSFKAVGALADLQREHELRDEADHG